MATRLAEVTDQALALPADDRLTLALKVWESLSDDERAATSAISRSTMAEVRRRDGEISSGSTHGRAHEEVIAAARRSLRCE